MTNEEKAREIAEYYTDTNDIGVALNSAKEMAEWKDEQVKESLWFYDKGFEWGKTAAKLQFKKYLEKKLEWVRGNRDSSNLNDPQWHDYVVQAEAYKELINEFFKKN